MEIRIPIKNCKRLGDKSKYNNRYYQLPDGITIDNCDIVYVDYHESDEFYMYYLGTLHTFPTNIQCITKYWIDYSDSKDEYLVFDVRTKDTFPT